MKGNSRPPPLPMRYRSALSVSLFRIYSSACIDWRRGGVIDVAVSQPDLRSRKLLLILSQWEET